MARSSRNAGAVGAGYVMLRLPWTVAPVFREWLERTLPARLPRIEARIRSTRGGRLNDSAFGTRMRGTGEMAKQIAAVFRLFARRYGLDRELAPFDLTRFRAPKPKSGQLTLF